MPVRVGLPAPNTPPASPRFDWIATGLSLLLITGLNIDIWAHNHDLADTTLNPSHLILALGFTLLMSGSIRSAWLQRETEGVARWIQIFPAGQASCSKPR